EDMVRSHLNAKTEEKKKKMACLCKDIAGRKIGEERKQESTLVEYVDFFSLFGSTDNSVISIADSIIDIRKKGGSEREINDRIEEKLEESGITPSIRENMGSIDDITKSAEAVRELVEKKYIMGDRATDHFPVNAPLMRDYANILNNIGFEGLTAVLTNIPSSCCNVMAARAPKLTRRIVGVNPDTIRMRYSITPEHGGKALSGNIDIIIPVIGNHDEYMILSPENLFIHQKEAIISWEQYKEQSELMGELRKEFMKNRTLNDVRARTENILSRYGQIKMFTSDVGPDAVVSLREVIEGMVSRDPKLIVGSVFDSEKEVFVNSPYFLSNTNGSIRIEQCPYKDKLEEPTRRRLDECIELAKGMAEGLLNKGVTKGMPREEQEPEPQFQTIYSGKAPPNVLILTKSKDRKNPSVNLYNPLIRPTPLAQIDYEKEKTLSEICFDGEKPILTFQETERDIVGYRKNKNTIREYIYDEEKERFQKQMEFSFDGDIAPEAMCIDDVVYMASPEKSNTCIRCFKEGREEDPYMSEREFILHSLGKTEIEGKEYLIGGSDGRIHIWTKEKKEKEDIILEEGGGYIGDIRTAGEICFASDMSSVYMWDIQENKLLLKEESFGGLYDIEEYDNGEHGKETEIAMVKNRRNNDYVIKISSIEYNGSTPELNEKCGIPSSEMPTYVSLHEGFLFVVQENSRILYARTESDTTLTSLTLERAKLEKICVGGICDELYD
ncbi:MAG: hypothetical protein R6U32_07395, partial [Candidatus Woesearchaeota archaeon]